MGYGHEEKVKTNVFSRGNFTIQRIVRASGAQTFLRDRSRGVCMWLMAANEMVIDKFWEFVVN